MLAGTIFDVDVIPAELRRQAVIKGSRVGGSFFCGLRLLHLGLPYRSTGSRKARTRTPSSSGPDMRIAAQPFKFALGAAQAHPQISRLVSDVTTTSFAIARENGRRVIVEMLPATRGGSAVRGRSLAGAVVTEGAFLRDENAAVNDLEIWWVFLPRIMPGGQLLFESTPWVQDGLLWDLFSGELWQADDRGRRALPDAPHARRRPGDGRGRCPRTSSGSGTMRRASSMPSSWAAVSGSSCYSPSSRRG